MNWEEPQVKERPVQPRFRSDICTDHWLNIIIYGQCWRHNEDGSLKSTFTKQI